MAKTSSVLIIASFALLIAGGAAAGIVVGKEHDAGGFKYPWESSSAAKPSAEELGEEPAASPVEIETTVKGTGIIVKPLSAGTDADGLSTKTFSYVVAPSDVDQSVKASVGWSDSAITGKRAMDFVRISLNTDKKTITLTAAEAFSDQITVSIVSKSDSSKAAAIVCECPKRFLGFIPYSKLEYKPTTIGIWESGNKPGIDLRKSFSSFIDPYFMSSKRLSSPGITNRIFETRDFSGGYSEVYSKDEEIVLSMSLSVPSSAKWGLYASFARHDGDGNVIEQTHVAYQSELASQTVAAGAVVNSNSNGDGQALASAVQNAVDGLPASTRAKLRQSLSEGEAYEERLIVQSGQEPINRFGIFTTDAALTLSASDGQTMSMRGLPLEIEMLAGYGITFGT